MNSSGNGNVSNVTTKSVGANPIFLKVGKKLSRNSNLKITYFVGVST